MGLTMNIHFLTLVGHPAEFSSFRSNVGNSGCFKYFYSHPIWSSMGLINKNIPCLDVLLY